MCMESGAVALKQTAFQLLYAASWALIQLVRSDQSSPLPLREGHPACLFHTG